MLKRDNIYLSLEKFDLDGKVNDSEDELENLMMAEFKKRMKK